MKWVYYHKDLSQQINLMLSAGIMFVILYSISDYVQVSFFKWVSLFCAAYLFVASILFTKKWIDKNYR